MVKEWIEKIVHKLLIRKNKLALRYYYISQNTLLAIVGILLYLKGFIGFYRIL